MIVRSAVRARGAGPIATSVAGVAATRRVVVPLVPVDFAIAAGTPTATAQAAGEPLLELAQQPQTAFLVAAVATPIAAAFINAALGFNAAFRFRAALRLTAAVDLTTAALAADPGHSLLESGQQAKAAGLRTAVPAAAGVTTALRLAAAFGLRTALRFDAALRFTAAVDLATAVRATTHCELLLDPGQQAQTAARIAAVATPAQIAALIGTAVADTALGLRATFRLGAARWFGAAVGLAAAIRFAPATSVAAAIWPSADTDRNVGLAAAVVELASQVTAAATVVAAADGRATRLVFQERAALSRDNQRKQTHR